MRSVQCIAALAAVCAAGVVPRANEADTIGLAGPATATVSAQPIAGTGSITPDVTPSSTATPEPTSTPAANPPLGPKSINATVVSLSFSGNGCPQGTVEVVPVSSASSSDPATSVSWQPLHVFPPAASEQPTTADSRPTLRTQTFGLRYSSFKALIGPRVSTSERTRNCQMHLNLKYAPGVTLALASLTNSGYASLDEGVTATTFVTSFFSQSAADTSTVRTTIQGGGAWDAGRTFKNTAVVPADAMVWGPCGATGILNVNNRVSLTSSSASAWGTVDLSALDDKDTSGTEIAVVWKRCNAE